MDTNPLNKGVITENSIGIGTVTRKMVRERARELALIEGRVPPQVLQVDYEQAKRELTGGADLDPQEAVSESAPESESWDAMPGSTGHKAPESPGEDEDDEGRSEGEQLVEQGVAEAEHNQMLQAARESAKQDKPES
jgi:hypothetical protein